MEIDLKEADGQLPTDPDIARRITNSRVIGTPFIDGDLFVPPSAQSLPNICPANGRFINDVVECGPDVVDIAVRSARRAYDDTWRFTPPGERKLLLMRFASTVLEHADELAALDSVDVGKPYGIARAVDVNSALRTLNWFAEATDKVYGDVAPTGGLDPIIREPLGVVAAVVPWNYPLMITSWKLGPVLAAGNTVVVKPAEQSPLSALRLGELAIEAGLPPGVLNVVTGRGEVTGRALGIHPGVSGIAFTGSTATGKLFLRYASESTLRRVALECGGKSALLVCADADVVLAADRLAAALFYNAGQSCNAPTRLLVHESRFDEILEALTSAAKAYFPNNPFAKDAQVGAIVSKSQLDRITGFVDRAADAGGTVVCGGHAVFANSGGFYYEPTIVTDVATGSEILQEEVFGPVLPIETFSNNKEALALANNTRYGLWANIFTRDLSDAQWFATRLDAGTVGINMTFGGDITTPFGGYKESGNSRDRSLHAMDEYTQLKHISFGRV